MLHVTDVMYHNLSVSQFIYKHETLDVKRQPFLTRHLHLPIKTDIE